MHALLTAPRESLTFEILEPSLETSGEIELRYRIRGAGSEDIEFTERISLPGDTAFDGADEASVVPLRLLALAAGLSYYKSCIPATVHVPGGLTGTERHFLTEVLTNGLGEFAFRNDVPHALHPEIDGPVLPDPARPDVRPGSPVRPLVAVGGGKDSIVTIESLRTMGVTQTLFSVNSYAPINDTAA